MAKTSPITAVAKGLCPRCRRGKMFSYPVYQLNKMTTMNKHCPCCAAPFEPEPGFYYGAMYISYAFSVAIFIVSFVVLYNFFGDPSIWAYMATVSVLVLVLLPVSFRYSRIVYLHLFGPVHYSQEVEERVRRSPGC